MIMTRTDIHRPSSPDFDPESYDLVDVFDLRVDSEGYDDIAYYNRTVRQLERDGITEDDVKRDQAAACGHCGARLRYAAIMIHVPSQRWIFVGQECLTNRFSNLTAAKFQELRRNASLNAERIRKSVKIAALVDAHPLLADLTYPQAIDDLPVFVRDIADKLRWYAELSEKQIAAVERAILQGIERRDRFAAERAAASPAPTGRVVVTGTVVSQKTIESDYGPQFKMLVKADGGFKVWTTVPSVIWDVENGQRVQFTATLEPSHDDETFAFGKRPSKASIL